MILEAAIIGGVAVGGWVLSKLLGRDERKAPPIASVKVREAARALKAGTATAVQLREAAEAAEIAGDYELAETFAARAIVHEGVEEARREAGRTSPLPGVADEAWRRYVAAARVPEAEPDYISPRFRLGLYGLDARALVDVGAMKSPRRGTWQGREVWLADWAPASAAWLEDPEQQYAALVKLAKRHADYIGKKHAAVIGRALEKGQPASLAGLLAVARIAGLGGLVRFVSAPEERFEHTLRAYRAANGIF